MKKKLLIVALAAVVAMAARAADRVVVAYVTSWSSIVPDPRTMTHINYAFGGVNSSHDGITLGGTGRLKMLVGLKKQNPALKVLVSIGGWGAGGFSPMAADSAKRAKFAAACRALCTQYNLDGIDIDWEFPGNNSSKESSPADEKHNYSLLMRDIRRAIGPDLLLTMASNYTPDNYNFRECIDYLDFVNVMCYNMAGNPNHHAALYRGGVVSKGYYTSQESVSAHLKAGIPRDKLVMGMPFYGNGSLGEISLARVNELIASGDYTDHWDDTGKVPYLTDKNGTMQVGYDNARSLGYKCDYILRQRLRGGMYWDYAEDDAEGSLRTTLYNKLLATAHADGDIRLDGQPMPLVAPNLFRLDLALQQGRQYTFVGDTALASPAWYPDPDYFVRTGDSTFRFQPLSGRYRVEVDMFERCFRVRALSGDTLAVYNPATGGGAIWVRGAAGSVGKPAYVPGGDTSWGGADDALCVAQQSPGQYRFTLTVGRQLNPSQVAFKFFFSPAEGADGFAPTGEYRVRMSDPVFGIGTGRNGHDAGNIFLRPGRSLDEGSIYAFCLDAANPSDVRLTVRRIREITDGIRPARISRSRPAADDYFSIDGLRLGPQPPGRPGIYIHKGKKILINNN